MIHIFIVNPYAGEKNFADDLREKLATIENLNYFVFNTRGAGYEAELVRKIHNIFEDEELRFYCCGGSGTMNKILNGFDNLEEAEVAFFPCGLTNDYLKVFGDDLERFNNIEELINGDVIEVDYIKTNHGVALNTFACGLDSKACTKLDDYRVLGYLGKQLPYVLSLLYSIFFSKPLEYEIKIDGKNLNGKYAEIIMGKGVVINGNVWFSEKINITDGKARFCMAGNQSGFALLPSLKAMTSKRFDIMKKRCKIFAGEKFSIKRNGEPFIINLDGELYKNIIECEAYVVKKGLKLVVPKGVTI